MLRASSLRSGFIAAVAFVNLLTLNVSVQGQALAQPNRVTSCIAAEPGTLTIITSSKVPLPAPAIQYLPGPDECTVLVADFAGLTWVGEPRIIRPEATGPGIIAVRVGQFQESPPICRVSVTSKNPKLFKGVSFQNLTGELLVKWGTNVAATDATLPTSLTPSRRLVPVYTEEQANTDGPSRRLLPAPVPGSAEEGAARIVEAATPVTRLLPPNAPNFNGSPSFLPPVSYQPLPPGPSSSAYDPGLKAAPAQAKQAVALKPAPGKTAGQPDPDADDLSAAHPVKRSGLLHKIAAKTGKLLNVNDRESHGQLTKPEPATVASGQQPATMKDEAGNATPAAAPDAKPQTAAKPEVPRKPLTIQMTSDETSVVENLKIDMTALRKLSYKTFRMHNPERYVIDFDQLPELTKLPLPDSDSPLFYRFRAGTLPDKPGIDRLVLDLPDDRVQIADKLDQDQNTLSLLLYRKDESLSGATMNGADPLVEPPLPDGTSTRPATATAPVPPVVAPKAPSKIIVLDAGHGGSDPGAQRSDINEKDLTLAIVLKLKHVLEQEGASVVMTRSDDTFVSLEDRVKITNQISPDLFLSVHINAMESANDISGIETYYQTDQSKPLADSIHQGLISGLGAPDRSIRKARFYVINHTQVPAVLAEVGFISNKEERQKLDTADYQEKIAESLARGVNTYLASHDTGLSRVAQSDSSKVMPTATAEGTTVNGTKSLTPSFAARSVERQTAF